MSTMLSVSAALACVLAVLATRVLRPPTTGHHHLRRGGAAFTDEGQSVDVGH
jgi:hypothetical protein